MNFTQTEVSIIMLALYDRVEAWKPFTENEDAGTSTYAKECIDEAEKLLEKIQNS